MSATEATRSQAADRPVAVGLSALPRFRRSALGALRRAAPILAVAVTGLLVRLLFAPSAPIFLEGDSQSYLLPGWELAQHAGFSPELRRAPLYPLLIGLSLSTLGPNLELFALVQHLLGVLTAVLTFLLGQRLFGRLVGLLAGLAIALSGPQLIYEHYLMSEALTGFLLTAALLAMAHLMAPPACTRVTHRTATPPRPELWAVVAGLALGLCALTRPLAQALLPVCLLGYLLLLPRWRGALRAAALSLLAFLIVTSPWMLRNLTTHGTPSAAGGLGRSLIARTVKYDSLFDWKWLSETYGGRDDLPARARMLLYRKRGNIPDSRSVRPYQDALQRELGLSQSQVETIMRQIALEAIARRPLDYIQGSLLFTVRLFVGREETFASHLKQRQSKDWEEQWDDRLDSLVVSPTATMLAAKPLAAWLVELNQPSRLALPLAGLTLLGIASGLIERRRRVVILLATIVMIMLLFSAFLDGPVPRYRYPLDPAIAVLAVGGLVSLIHLCSSRSGHHQTPSSG